MLARYPRREFLQTAAAGGALLGLGDLSFLIQLRPVSADEAKPDPKLVRLDAGIEPLVRLLEDTPREKLLEEVAARIKKGLNYRELLAALQLAGVRNVQPRPRVGFKFHAVLVVNSAHLASLSSPDGDRWLPIFWSLDYFKSAQAKNKEEGGWRMGPVNEAKIPSPRKARQAFAEAMNNWDEDAADIAVAGLARSAGAQEVFELFAQYGPRDFRDIGHKAIFVANSWRALQCIGWQHAEPILRSLAYALLRYDKVNPAKGDEPADRPMRRNRELASKIRPEWHEGKVSKEATADFLAALREGSEDEACDKVVALLNNGTAVQSLWDGLFAGAGELLMRQPGIIALHSITSTNAMHYAFQQSANDETRRLLLLQNAAFIPLFRKNLDKLSKDRVDALEPLPLETKEPLSEIFTAIGQNRMMAARKTLTYLKEHPEPRALMNMARLLVFLKGHDSHDYKFSSAVLEDYDHVSPQWRGPFLAASMFELRGANEKDNALVDRTRAALKS
jgi:hypothetical protein